MDTTEYAKRGAGVEVVCEPDLRPFGDSSVGVWLHPHHASEHGGIMIDCATRCRNAPDYLVWDLGLPASA